MIRAYVFADDPALWVLDQLRGIGLYAALILGAGWFAMYRWRERMLRSVVKELPPEQHAAVRAAARAAPLLRLRRDAPKDGAPLTTPVVVQPFGDGRPGEAFLAPGPAAGPPAPFDELRGRQDARVALRQGTHLLVVCCGPVGARSGDVVVLPARERVLASRENPRPGKTFVGPVDEVPMAFGTGWRSTISYGRSMLTDTHVDHDGWAFIVGVISTSWHTGAVELADRVLATWRWLPAVPAPPAPDPYAEVDGP